ncbi:MAG: S26 family signal peptidase [Porphyromonas sp.]|nr:S26 family signal peptidase [Porphyromonas sp.]
MAQSGKQKDRSPKRRTVKISIGVLLLLFVLLLIRVFLWEPVRVHNNIEKGEHSERAWVLIQKRFYSPLKRGDVVVFSPVESPSGDRLYGRIVEIKHDPQHPEILYYGISNEIKQSDETQSSRQLWWCPPSHILGKAVASIHF